MGQSQRLGSGGGPIPMGFPALRPGGRAEPPAPRIDRADSHSHPAAPTVQREAEEGWGAMTIGKAPSAEFEISIDGKPRSYATRRAIAIEAAEYLKRKFPNCDVVVTHLPSGEVTVAAYKPDDDLH
jgi:hypothetical protein